MATRHVHIVMGSVTTCRVAVGLLYVLCTVPACYGFDPFPSLRRRGQDLYRQSSRRSSSSLGRPHRVRSCQDHDILMRCLMDRLVDRRTVALTSMVSLVTAFPSHASEPSSVFDLVSGQADSRKLENGLLESRVLENVMSPPPYGMEGPDVFYPE